MWVGVCLGCVVPAAVRAWPGKMGMGPVVTTVGVVVEGVLLLQTAAGFLVARSPAAVLGVEALVEQVVGVEFPVPLLAAARCLPSWRSRVEPGCAMAGASWVTGTEVPAAGISVVVFGRLLS